MAPETTNASTSTPQQEQEIKPQNTELYRQIAREDAVKPVDEKKHKSLIMSIIVGMMRFTLYTDSLRRSNELLFRKLNTLWGIFMGVLYLSGILVVIFSVYNRLKLPLYLEDQLKARGIQFESANYDMDRIEVHQLKGPNGLYTVDTLIAYTTFTDLLQKRIRLVTLDGLTINLDEETEFRPLQDIPVFLSRLQHPARGNMDLAINAITVNNAKLNFQKEQMALPLSFSMEGIYNGSTQIIIPVMLDQPHLKFQGTLTVAGSNKKPEWILKISKGNITLPRRAPEDFVGEITVNLSDKKLEAIKAEFTLGTGTIKKKLSANLNQKDAQALAGSISWNRENTTEPSLSSDLSFQIDDLSFFDDESLQTKGNLTIDSKQFNLYNIAFQNLHMPLQAEISCKNWKSCTFDLLENATVSLSDFQFTYQRQKFRATTPFQFTLNAGQQLIVMDAEHSDLQMEFNLPIRSLVFAGKDQSTGDNLKINSEKIALNAIWADEPRVTLLAEDLSYQSTEIVFNKTTLNISDVLQPTARISMHAREMRVPEQALLAQPFDIVLNMIGNQVAAKLNFHNQPITADVEGRFSLAQRIFSGQINIPPFRLQELTVPLNELWPSVPQTVINPTGEIAVKGLLKWQKGHISGDPLYVGFQDVAFELGDTKIDGINTVLAIESLTPLTTKSNQHLFIQNIEALIPLQSLDTLFQLDNQGLKVNQLMAYSASIPLVLPPSIITPQVNGLVLYLRNNRPIDLQQLQQATHLSGVDVVTGSASISVPIEFKNNIINIPHLTLKVQDVQLNRQKDSYKNLFGSQTAFLVRNGQITLNQNKSVQIALNGNLLPSKQATEVQLDTFTLPDDFIKKTPAKKVPSDIQERLKALFSEQ